MGRDHHNLQLTVAHTREAARVGTARVTEWRLFRNEVNVETTIDNVDNWLKEVLDTAVRHAKRIKLNEEVPAVDIHFIHLWEARRSEEPSSPRASAGIFEDIRNSKLARILRHTPENSENKDNVAHLAHTPWQRSYKDATATPPLSAPAKLRRLGRKSPSRTSEEAVRRPIR
ncbi:hypothetical protein HPB52_014860 [Rhipicephalus sanguineus]|uniref:Uncharacterized protein n=1 Tax=Rhipicephalus sanguineus TaxID=34632 RepID=A0A9D4TAI2_RHISA|nr:hypothetical protein HPB52_014860 [Rhipicephalus sanguineus]